MSTHAIPPEEVVSTADGRVILHGVTWEGWLAQLQLRGDKSAPRLTYLDGAMELMSPSKDHERIKSYLGRLVETYAMHHGIDLSPYGGWTLQEEVKRAGLEPDECYIVGLDQDRPRPHLAIEVVWTSGGLDKLEAYRRLGVPEVWFWKKAHLTVHVLVEDAYQERTHSLAFPDLVPAELLQFLDHPTVTQAIRALLESLRAG